MLVNGFVVDVRSVLEENLAVDRSCPSTRQRSAWDTNLDCFGVCVTCCRMQRSPFFVHGMVDVRSVFEEDLRVNNGC